MRRDFFANVLCAFLAMLFIRQSIAAAAPPGISLADFPPLMLWAWERPERLHFIEPRQIGVAYLARTIYLRGAHATVRPRFQPLRVPTATFLAAVVRIESDSATRPTFETSQMNETIGAIMAVSTEKAVRAVQIDFDAALSERGFYRQLLHRLRKELPGQIPLTITALASWCIGDNWLDDLPIDDAVPMLFRMGVGQREVSQFLASNKPFRAALCRGSIGVSLDEPLARLPSHRRKFVFNPKPWSAVTVARALEDLK